MNLKKKMIYKQGYWEQIIFIRDTISSLLAKMHSNNRDEQYEFYRSIKENVKVINTHMSKSISLLVYYIQYKNIEYNPKK